MGLDNSSPKRTVLHVVGITLAGFAVALVMCFVIFPRVEHRFTVDLDPDAYGRLGQNLRQGYGITFEPGDGPTVRRGPLLPVFIALTLFVTSDWYPGGVWVAQSLLHGLTCAFVYLAVVRCWDRKAALVGALACVVYPMLFWYAPRIYNEALLIFLVSCLAYVSILLVERPTVLKAAVIGALIGLLSLGRGTFLPLIVALPLCFLLLVPRRKLAVTLPVVIVSVLIIVPWTVRNYIHTKKIVLIHTGAGLNLKLGGMCTRTFLTSPFGYRKLWVTALDEITPLIQDVTSPPPMYDVEVDRIYMESALADLRERPTAIFSRAVIAGAMFWYMGETPLKTAALFILRAPVFLLSLIGIYKVIRLRQVTLWPSLVILLVYWLAHTPFVPAMRFSAPLTPIMCVFAIATWHYFREARVARKAPAEAAGSE